MRVRWCGRRSKVLNRAEQLGGDVAELGIEAYPGFGLMPERDKERWSPSGAELDSRYDVDHGITQQRRLRTWRQPSTSNGMKHICVYLAGNIGHEKRHVEQAETLGRLMATEGIGLVYGGARVGLMGVLANAVLAYGGSVTGVIPRHLQYQNVAHEGLSHLHVVDTMHERKHKMQSLSDASLALPGGFGTIEEIFEALTWAQIELHEKPCVLLNSNGYYDYLFKFLDHAVTQGLLKDKNRALAQQAPTAESALRIIQTAWAEKEKALVKALRSYQR